MVYFWIGCSENETNSHYTCYGSSDISTNDFVFFWFYSFRILDKSVNITFNNCSQRGETFHWPLTESAIVGIKYCFADKRYIQFSINEARKSKQRPAISERFVHMLEENLISVCKLSSV